MSKHTHLQHLGATIFALVLLVVCGFDVFTIPVAHAASGGISENVMWIASSTVAMLITILNFLLWIVFWMLNILLDPAFIFDYNTTGGSSLMGMLQSIWQFSRDIVNIAFAFMLVIGAILTIVKADTSRVKELAPKFVLAIVLVNFSWFIPRVLFDVSQVLTYTAFQIPSLVGSTDCSVPFQTNPDGTIKKKKCGVVVDVKFPPIASDFVVKPKDADFGWECPLPGLICIETVALDSPRVSDRAYTTVLNGLIVNHARLRTMATISDPTGSGAMPGNTGIRATVVFLVNLCLLLALEIALFFPLLALVVALFIRIPILWLTMAAMPFVAISYVIGDQGAFTPTKIKDEFIKAVFMPAMVAVPLSVGFVLVNAGANMPAPGALTQAGTAVSFFTGISDYWQLLWMCIAIFVLYSGTFMVLKGGNSVVSGIAGNLEGFGKSMAQLAIKAPLAVPFIPAPGGRTVTPLEAMKKSDPRKLLQNINQTGRLDPRGLSRPAIEDINAKALRKEHIQKDTKVDIQINNVLRNPRSPAGTAALDAAIKEMKDKHPGQLMGDDSAVIEGFIKKRKEIGQALNDAQQKALRDALDEKRKTTLPAAPAPAPATPAPAAPTTPAPAAPTTPSPTTPTTPPATPPPGSPPGPRPPGT